MKRRTFLQLVAAAALARPARAARSPLNRALGAALCEFLRDSSDYRAIYREYLGIEPRLVPMSLGEAWPPAQELKPWLDRGELRLGYCYNPPYQLTEPGGEQGGLDYDMGLALMTPLRRRYGQHMRLHWVEKTVGKSTGDDQVDICRTLFQALQAGEIDAGFSGLLVLADQPVQWTCPSSLLFTGLFYTGKGGLPLGELRNGSRQQLLEALGKWRDVELTFMATENPGPSWTTNRAFVDEVVRRGGKARAVGGTVRELQAALREAPVHFVIGDAVSLSYFCNRPDFKGVNLNMPASDVVMQLAPFTL